MKFYLAAIRDEGIIPYEYPSGSCSQCQVDEPYVKEKVITKVFGLYSDLADAVDACLYGLGYKLLSNGRYWNGDESDLIITDKEITFRRTSDLEKRVILVYDICVE